MKRVIQFLLIDCQADVVMRKPRPCDEVQSRLDVEIGQKYDRLPEMDGFVIRYYCIPPWKPLLSLRSVPFGCFLMEDAIKSSHRHARH